MDFSSLVLMERDKATNMLTKEIGSYEVNEGAEYIVKMYCVEDQVTVYFDTKEDVEDWQYSAIYELFDEEAFVEAGYPIEFDEEEFNPTWVVKFNFIDDHMEMKAKINSLCGLIQEKIKEAFLKAEENKEQYI